MAIYCRPILLHNEYIPARMGKKRDWDYQAFGHYDGVTVLERISMDNFASLQQLNAISAEHSVESAPFFTQYLYGFCSNESEEGFWNKEYAFTYLCLIQFEKKDIVTYSAYLSAQYLKDERETLGIEDSEKFEVQTYYTLDNSDLILVIKCARSQTGAKLINNLHQDRGHKHIFTIRNTYSILALRRRDVEKEDGFAVEDDTVNMLELRISECGPDSIGKLYRRLKTELDGTGANIERKILLGTEDEEIIIRNIKWNRLVRYYRQTDGILCIASPEAQQYANAVSSKILMDESNETTAEVTKKKAADSADAEVQKKETDSSNTQEKAVLCGKMQEMISEIYRDAKTAGDRFEKKTLMTVVKALERFEYAHSAGKEVFSDYTFYSMYLPFFMFIELLAEKPISEIKTQGFFSFMENIMLRTQNFTKPERVYMQVVDFNIRFYDMPAKLVTLYSAYVYYMKKILNVKLPKQDAEKNGDEREYKYEFLICPGVNSQTEVKEIFERISENKRLFMIELPEEQLYNPKPTMVVLGHEISHFVGGEIRQRKLRLEKMIRIYSRIIVLGIKNYALEDKFLGKDSVADEIWDDLEDRLNEWLPVRLEKFEVNNKFYQNYLDHGDVLAKVLFEVAEELLIDNSWELFGFIVKRQFLAEVDEVKYENRDLYYAKNRKKLEKYVYLLIGKKGICTEAFTLRNEIGQVMYFLKECYADILCILTLRLSLEDYLDTIASSIDAAGKSVEELENTEIIARIAFVTVIMRWEDDGSELFRWRQEEQLKTYSSWKENLQTLNDKAQMFIATYMNDPKDMLSGTMIKNQRDIIYDKKIIGAILSYLWQCCRDCYQAIQARREDYDRVASLYQCINSDQEDPVFYKMMKLLDKYEADIYNDIKEEQKRWTKESKTPQS